MQSVKPQRLRASGIILYLPEDQSDCDLAHAHFCFITIEIKQFLISDQYRNSEMEWVLESAGHLDDEGSSTREAKISCRILSVVGTSSYSTKCSQTRYAL